MWTESNASEIGIDRFKSVEMINDHPSLTYKYYYMYMYFGLGKCPISTGALISNMGINVQQLFYFCLLG